jgi:hypothetical protein
MNRPSHHLSTRQTLILLTFAIVLVMGFGGLWPEWMERLLAWAASAALWLTLGAAVVLGGILAFLLIVRPRR